MPRPSDFFDTYIENSYLGGLDGSTIEFGKDDVAVTVDKEIDNYKVEWKTDLVYRKIFRNIGRNYTPDHPADLRYPVLSAQADLDSTLIGKLDRDLEKAVIEYPSFNVLWYPYNSLHEEGQNSVSRIQIKSDTAPPDHRDWMPPFKEFYSLTTDLDLEDENIEAVFNDVYRFLENDDF